MKSVRKIVDDDTFIKAWNRTEKESSSELMNGVLMRLRSLVGRRVRLSQMLIRVPVRIQLVKPK